MRKAGAGDGAAPAVRRVLYLSPLPPPAGGIASWTRHVLAQGLPGGYMAEVLDTRRHAAQGWGPARLSPGTLLRGARIFRRLLPALLWRRPRLIHLNSSLSPTGIVQNLLLALLIRLAGVPLVSHYRGNLRDFPGHALGGLGIVCLRGLLALSHRNIVLNEDSYRYALELGSAGVSGERLRRLANFVADELLVDLAARETELSRPPRAVFVGTVAESKGCRELMEAAGRIPGVEFSLVGAVDPAFAPLLDAAPGNVRLHGAQPHDATIARMRASDFFVFPSHTEGFPMAVAEAMALGLPVVATRVGAIPEMVEEGKGGLLVDSGDASALAAAISRMAEDAGLRDAAGEWNREKIRREYAYSRVAPRLTALYDEVLDPPGRTLERDADG